MRGTALPKTAQPPFHTVGRSTGILIVAVTLVAFVHRPCLNPKSNAHPTGRHESLRTTLKSGAANPSRSMQNGTGQRRGYHTKPQHDGGNA